MENDTLTFSDFGFCPEINQGIEDAGFTEPTPIQKQAMRPILEGHDLIGQALTGTGKTAAFGLPIMHKMAHQKGLQFLILTPTRELAAQVSDELFRLGKHAELHTAAFTGGQSYSRQEKLLKMGIDILVATPGRLLDLIHSGHFKDISPKYFVVDEADEMLDMGFIDDVKEIFAAFPGERQTMLFSATMPKPIIDLAQTILHDPVQITVTPKETTNNVITQYFYLIEEDERTPALIRLIDAEDVGKAMIFCSTKEETDSLNILLGQRGYNVNCLHGDMEQAQRSRVMAAFRRGDFNILVATDVAARGLDVDDVTHVFNYRLPYDSRGYVHRIGRTGRAGKTGTAITLITPRELRRLETVRNKVGAQIENRTIPTYGEVLHANIKRLFAKVESFNLDPNIQHHIEKLTQGKNLLEILARLTEHILIGNSDHGPEQIGIVGDRLTDILEHKRIRRPRKDDDGERSERGGRRRSPRRREEGEERPRREDRNMGERHSSARKERDDERPPRREKRNMSEGFSGARKERDNERPRRRREEGEERPHRRREDGDERPRREKRNMSEGFSGARKERGDDRPPRKEKTEKRFKDTFSNKEVGGDKKPSKRNKNLPWYMQ